ncbi:MAG: hypothetical protein M1825_002224 [Sarcosagium campestre]|nr:MAG: hypothetical protein M1825_002224 [Sarcosagium campestre]
MSAEHWTRAVESGTWSRHRREELVSKEIQLPGVSGYSEDNTESDSFQMFCPLVPLTIPRRVIRSFGNIVSQLDGGDGDVRPLPASMELEESLDKYTYALGLRPQAMMIWALILPPHVGQRWSFTSKIEDSWVGALADHAQNIKAAIDSGARLHRVLSGGGGWGDKSGLLSVDPEASYSIAKEDNTIHSSLDVEVGGLGKLQEVFTENDYVQFLVAPPTLAEEMASGYPLFVEDAQPDVDETKGAIPDHYIHLGVSVPFDGTKSIENSIGGKSVNALSRVFAHFGALSEQGMAYRREIQQPDRQDEGEILRTKIDVPHTRASFKV